ncbi:hypothetical protein TcasGA2_TC034229 [Tribolium castaneum]|uniref:Uncharacterized protein n=1 Tax=Tribolium castaneum TaxID=7070 RepID=A0A139WC69_TRICA|nr:hypothetical protein TcasGA2_TC034229 [Tribolium castaneum]
MVYSWDSVAKEANKTGLLVHKYWNEFHENTTITSENDDNFGTISLQLLQSKLKFTVCGFVDLDWSLIHLIIQTTAMYLVWIIQLKS